MHRSHMYKVIFEFKEDPIQEATWHVYASLWCKTITSPPMSKLKETPQIKINCNSVKCYGYS